MTKMDRISPPASATGASHEVYERAREAVRDFLPDPATLSDDQRRIILRRYAAGVGENFIKWLAAATLCTRSLEARYAAAENALLEIRDDHPGMLRGFVASSGASPEREDYDYVARYLADVQVEVSRMPGLFLTTFLGILEHTSTDYIPWLAELSTPLGNTNFAYADIHGEADILHADQFVWALEKEAAHYDDPDIEIGKANTVALSFLKAILTAD